MLPAGHRQATSWVHYTTSCNTQSNIPEDGQNNCPKHVELSGIINKPLLLHLVGCRYFLYQWCTVKQISDNEIYLLIKYIKSLLWRVAKCLSNTEEARCLKVKISTYRYFRSGNNRKFIHTVCEKFFNVEAAVTCNYHCSVYVLSTCKNKMLKRIFGSVIGVPDIQKVYGDGH